MSTETEQLATFVRENREIQKAVKRQVTAEILRPEKGEEMMSDIIKGKRKRRLFFIKKHFRIVNLVNKTECKKIEISHLPY